MVAFGHTAVGVITGVATYHLTQNWNPTLSLATATTAGIASHYITDAIPHGHFFKYKEFKKKVGYAIIFDFLLSLIIFGSLAYYQFGLTLPFFIIAFAVMGAQLPDILDGLIYTDKLPNKGPLALEVGFHQATHWHGKLDKALLLGKRDIWQVVTIGVAVALLI